MSGRKGDLSPEQESTLNKLKHNLKDVLTPYFDDLALLRFLRSRNFDLAKTEKKVKETIEFRKKYGADTILEDWSPPELMIKYFTDGYLPKLDKNNHPITLLCLGQFDLKGLMKCFPREDLLKYKVYSMELGRVRVKELVANTGIEDVTITAIIDMQGLSSYHLWRPGLQLFSEFMQFQEMHYPELVNKGFFINCPRIFNTIYAIVKPFIDPNTREKLEVLGSNYKDRLVDFIGASSLMEEYGGTIKKEEVIHVHWGGRIPKEMYKENDDSLQHQFIKPGKSHTIEVSVDKVGSELVWEFLTENHDISFAVYFVENGKNVVVQEGERVSSHLGNVNGSLTCDKTGTYILEWDNSFSWTKGKNLKYKYDVVPPAEE